MTANSSNDNAATTSPPRTPLTPETALSRDSTCVGDDEKDTPEREAAVATKNEQEASASPDVSVQNVQQDDTFDAEAQQPNPRRNTFTDSLKRAGTSLSGRIPVHWRPNYLSSGRNSQRIDDHPMGYPRLGSFMNSDENFLICRRYSLLHTRVMLYRQAELAQLERELFELDQEDEQDGDRALKSVKFLESGEKGEDRMDLVRRIDEKLKEYGTPPFFLLFWKQWNVGFILRGRIRGFYAGGLQPFLRRTCGFDAVHPMLSKWLFRYLHVGRMKRVCVSPF